MITLYFQPKQLSQASIQQFASLLAAGSTSLNINSMKFVHYVEEGSSVTLSCKVSCGNINAKVYPKWNLQVPWYEKAFLLPLESRFMRTHPISVFDNFSMNPLGEIQCSNAAEPMFYLNLTGVKTTLDHSVLWCGVRYGSDTRYTNRVMYIFVNRTGKEL